MSSEWSKYLAKGVPVAPGEEIPVRQDIRDLSKEQKYLYLEGLKRFQHVSTDDPLSYFQIAGIHGLPYQTWPNKGWNEDIPARPKDFDEEGGFCTHSSILFLTWHRPYLALFESALYGHVQEVASQINPSHPEKQEYVTLAKRFRIPFWDWARKDTQIFPKEALDKDYHEEGPPLLEPVQVSREEKYNPLFAYPFAANTPTSITRTDGSGRPFKTTVRHPKSRNPEIENIIGDFYKDPSTWDGLPVPATWDGLPIVIPESNLAERTAWILQAYKTFPAMSNNELRQSEGGKNVEDRTNWGSLEDIHNAVHSLVGNGGHMSGIDVSAFDPIFWLHHTNIDRLYDIWQALHEDDKNRDTFVVERKAGSANFTTPTQGVETIDSPLYPFRPDVNSWYTSKTVQRTKDFGYSYPETAGLKYPTSQADKEELLDKIGKIYGSLPRTILESKKHIPTAGADLLARAHIAAQIDEKVVPATAGSLGTLLEHLPDPETLLQTSLEPSKPFLRDLAPDYKYLEWMTNIKAEKHTLDGAYSVHVFLGPPDDETDAALWPISPTHVGTFAPLGQPSTTGCEKCQEDQRDRMQVTGQIPLTIALVERYLAGIIPGLTESDVVDYLTKELHWRVVKTDGTVLDDRSVVHGLKVFVVSNEVTIPEDDTKPPIYAPDVTIHADITTNARGGGRGNGTGLARDEVPQES